MITENRWKHILAVARKAKTLAEKLKPGDEKYAEDMFLLGLLHDFGYEFAQNNIGHAVIGGNILKRSGYKYWQEVAEHGDETIVNMSDELFILNCADMTSGPNGEDFVFAERLEENAARFGKDSLLYKKSVIVVENLESDVRYAQIR